MMIHEHGTERQIIIFQKRLFYELPCSTIFDRILTQSALSLVNTYYHDAEGDLINTNFASPLLVSFSLPHVYGQVYRFYFEGFNDWGGRGYDDFVPGEVTKIIPSGDETT